MICYINELYIKTVSKLDNLLNITHLKKDYTMTHLKTGDNAPDFTVPVKKGKNITLSAIQDKYIVLYFYPRDDTPGCTIEAKDFDLLNGKFDECNTAVFGISNDSIESHDKFKEKYDLNSLNLLSDEDKDICEKYGVWGKKNIMGKEYIGVSRTTFLIGPKHKILKIWEDVNSIDHAKEVLHTVQELEQTDKNNNK